MALRAKAAQRCARRVIMAPCVGKNTIAALKCALPSAQSWWPRQGLPRVLAGPISQPAHMRPGAAPDRRAAPSHAGCGVDRWRHVLQGLTMGQTGIWILLFAVAVLGAAGFALLGLAALSDAQFRCPGVQCSDARRTAALGAGLFGLCLVLAWFSTRRLRRPKSR